MIKVYDMILYEYSKKMKMFFSIFLRIQHLNFKQNRYIIIYIGGIKIMVKESCLNQRVYNVSKVGNILQVILISICMFLIPLVVPTMLGATFGAESVIANNSQYIVGALVNSALIVSALTVKGWKSIIALVTVPSISALTSGLVLNVASIFTVYMIPAIWLGNMAIIYGIKYLHIQKNINYIVSVAIGIIAKVTLIFGGFNLLTVLINIPTPVSAVLSTAMGINQVITAVIGSVLAYGTVKLIYREKEIKK